MANETRHPWWKLQKISSDDYGKIAIFGIVSAGLRGIYGHLMGPTIGLLFDVVITFGLISGILWIMEQRKQKK